VQSHADEPEVEEKQSEERTGEFEERRRA